MVPETARLYNLFDEITSHNGSKDLPGNPEEFKASQMGKNPNFERKEVMNHNINFTDWAYGDDFPLYPNQFAVLFCSDLLLVLQGSA